MILRKLFTENFRQLFGKNTIEFAQLGPRNVTAILGENGAGKTTLLNAFVWCLYGKIEMANEESLVSFKALQDAAIGSTVSAEVSLVFETDDAVYTVRRRAVFQKADGGKTVQAQDEEFRIDRVGRRDGVTSKLPDPKQFVSEVIPAGLSKFFFFRGEDMEALASQDAKSVARLKEGVESFLDIELLDRASRHADDLRRELEREGTQQSHGDLKDLGDKIEAVNNEIESLKQRLAQAKETVQNHEARKIEVERALAKVEETRPFLEKKSSLETQLQALEATEAIRKKAVAAIISRDGYLLLGGEVLKTPVRLANDAAQRGELPAKIKPGFVDDRIELGTCICGRPVDDAARSALMEWKKNKGLAGLDAEITTLRSQVGELELRRDNARNELVAARQALSDVTRDIRDSHDQLSAVESEIKGTPFELEYVRDLQRNFTSISDQIITAKVDEQRLSDQLTTRKLELEELDKERAKKSRGMATLERTLRRAQAVSKVAKALDQMRQGWVQIVQRYLDTKLQDTWTKVAALDRRVAFTQQFTLTMHQQGGHGEWTPAAPSQANQRALALMFVASLVRLADDIAAAPDGAKRSVFKGGKYPLVMDAPFATMDKYFKETLPVALQETVPQLVIISNHAQWEGQVSALLGPKIGKRYVLELHCNKEDRFVDFQGDQVLYVVKEPTGVNDFTVVKEVRQS